MSTELLKNKTICITGATGGLGQQLAYKCGQLGAKLLLMGRNCKKLDTLITALHHKNINAQGYCLDLTKQADVISCGNQILHEHDAVDVLIHAAGVFPIKPLMETSPCEYEAIMSVNVTSAFNLAKLFAPQMRENNWGRIVNIGSSSAYNGSAETGAYCVSKHALLGLSRSLFLELKSDNVRVYSISPGSMQTAMGESDTRQDFSTFVTPEEVADYVIFCMSFDKELISEEIRLNRTTIR